MCSRGIPDRSDPFASFGQNSRGLQIGHVGILPARPLIKPLKETTRKMENHSWSLVKSAPLFHFATSAKSSRTNRLYQDAHSSHLPDRKTRSAPCFRASVPRRSSDITFWPFMDISFAKIPPYDSHPLGKLRLFKMQKEIW